MDVIEEDGRITKDKGLEINVQVDRSVELEAKQAEIDNLKSEKAQLESALETIAEKALKEKCEKYGIPEDLDDEIRIQKVKEAEINGSKGMSGFTSDMLTSQKVYGKSTLSGEFESIPEMMSELNRKAKDSKDPDSPVAEAILKELAKKELQAVKTHGRENFVGDIDPQELKRFREDSKREIARKRLKLQ